MKPQKLFLITLLTALSSSVATTVFADASQYPPENLLSTPQFQPQMPIPNAGNRAMPGTTPRVMPRNFAPVRPRMPAAPRVSQPGYGYNPYGTRNNVPRYTPYRSQNNAPYYAPGYSPSYSRNYAPNYNRNYAPNYNRNYAPNYNRNYAPNSMMRNYRYPAYPQARRNTSSNRGMPFNNSSNGNNSFPFSSGNMPFMNNGNNSSMNPFGNMFGNNSNNNNNKMPFFGNTRSSDRKKAWGKERNIWPDFYTDFTDDAWDSVSSGPRDLGVMPGGWRFPHISSPDPVTVSDAITNQFPPIAEEAGNMMDVSDWGVFDEKDK